MHPFKLRHDIPPVELAPGVAMSFKVIPPVDVQQAALARGHSLSFMMGSRDGPDNEKPRHRVIIPQPFYMGEFPVTQAQFACFLPAHQNGFPGPDHPVDSIDWNLANEFLRWLGTHAKGIPEAWSPRLPCEAEWEYACRAGTDTDYWSGDGEADLASIALYKTNSAEQSHAVGSVARPNPWGLFDMHGNLWEWCQDVYDPRAYAKRPHGWSACVCEDFNPTKREEVSRVMRGGSWNNVASSCRSASRGRRQHSVKGWSRGFRVLLSPPENSQGASQPI